MGKPHGGVRHVMAMMIEGSLELISTTDIPGIGLAPRTHALRAPHAKIRTQMENFRHEYEAKMAGGGEDGRGKDDEGSAERKLGAS